MYISDRDKYRMVGVDDDYNMDTVLAIQYWEQRLRDGR